MKCGKAVTVVLGGGLVVVGWCAGLAVALPDHPIITEVYTDPPGLDDGPVRRPPANEHQGFIEIYLPPASALNASLNKEALKITFYEVEGDVTSSGLGLINYRFDLPTFDLNPSNGITNGAIPRPSSGVVVLGWVDYLGDPPSALAGTPNSRLGLVNGGITSQPNDYLFIAINGHHFSGTSNFPVLAAESLIDLPGEAISGVIQNGSSAYLLVNRDSAGYVELCDRQHPTDCAAGSAPALPDDLFGLATSALFDGFAGNDHDDFRVDKQPYRVGEPIDLVAVLPENGAFSLLIAQVPELDEDPPAPGMANGYARIFVDIPKTGNPASDAVEAYRHVRNDGPFFPSPGFAALRSSVPKFGVALNVEQTFEVLRQTTGGPGLLCANTGGDVGITMSATGGASSNASVATFSPGASVSGILGQSYGFPGVTVTVGAGATHGATASATVTVSATRTGGGPTVEGSPQTRTITATVLGPSQGRNANGQPFQATVFLAVQPIPAGGTGNALLSTDLGAFLDDNLGGLAQDTMGNGALLTNPSTNLSNGATVRALVKEYPDQFIDYLNLPGAPGTLDLVNTVLQSAEAQVHDGTYAESFDPGFTALKAIRLNTPDTQTFDGTFSPSETLHFANANGFVGDPRSGLTNATTTRTFELVIIDTNVRLNGTVETGATDDFGIIAEVLETEPSSSVLPGEFVFLSFTGGLQGADIDTLDVPPHNNVANLIYLDLDNLHSVLGIRSIELVVLVDSSGNGELDVIEVFSLNPAELVGCEIDADCTPPFTCCPSTAICSECAADADCIVDGQPFCDPADCSCKTCFTAQHCDDSDPCTDDSCNAGVCQHFPLQCLPGQVCCPNSGQCVDGCCNDQECDDGLACTIDTCDGVTGLCQNVPNNAACDNGVFCDGVELCSASLGCGAGAPIDCDDGLACTVDSCNVLTDSCDNDPDDAFCDNGLFCDGQELCDPLADCQSGTPPCPAGLCDEVNQVCLTCQFDSDCDDEVFCNGAEMCVSGACESGTPPDCDDGLPCTVDSCREVSESCLHTPNDAACDNGVFCDGVETCDPILGCQAGSTPGCNDGLACTIDSCNVVTDSCDNDPDDAFCNNGLFCDGEELCDPLADCQPGSVPCPPALCDEVNQVCLTCEFDSDCDDGVFCNGVEMCVSGTCESGTPPDCDDGLPCTVDSCQEISESCLHTPSDAACDNGVFCDGVETCDSVFGCEFGIPVSCDDGVSCTVDSCNVVTDSCENDPDDAFCDNGLFCDGLETCDRLTDCQPGEPPCLPGMCDEGAGECGSCQDNGDCDDGNECTFDFCANSQCSNPPLVDNTPCADGQGTCQSGECVASGCTNNIDCDDGNSCTFDLCIDSACVNTEAEYADVAGTGGSCGPDGDVNLNDILAVLDGFAASFADPCSPSNIDIAGAGGACAPNGVIDLADILAVLDAFQGSQDCCPAP